MQIDSRNERRHLERDIERLSVQIARRPIEPTGMRERCANAYLKALLDTKRESLALLKRAPRHN